MPAKSRAEKKIFSLEYFDFINLAIKDVSAVERRTESAIAEDILLTALLPSNREAAQIIKENYSSENAVFEMLNRVISKYCVDASIGNAKNHVELVRFVYNLVGQTQIYLLPEDANKGNLNVLLKEFEMLADVLKRLEANMEELSNERFELHQHIYYLEDHIAILRNNRGSMPLIMFPHFLINVWDYVYNNPYAYNGLAAVVSAAAPIANTAEYRHELYNLIKQISNDWT